MQTIRKYDIPAEDMFVLEMPEGAELLSVQTTRQPWAPFLWALVDPDKPNNSRWFALHKAGRPIVPAEHRFIGTFQTTAGDMVLHLFELL